MHKSLAIENFRCFNNLTVEPLSRVNLFVGKNNVGKTALLEAIWFQHGFFDPDVGRRANVFRGVEQLDANEFMWDFFPEFDIGKSIVSSSLDFDGRYRTLDITLQERPTSRVASEQVPAGDGEARASTSRLEAEASTDLIQYQVVFDYTDSHLGSSRAVAYPERGGVRFDRATGIRVPNAIFLAARHRESVSVLAQRYSKLLVDQEDDTALEALRIIEDRLKRIVVGQTPVGPIIWADIGLRRLIALPLLGEGMSRILSIVLALKNSTNGILLIDEAENGFHYSVLEQVWKLIGHLARKWEVQVFATTHSEECVRAAHHAFRACEEYDFALHRIEQIEGVARSVHYDKDILDAAIEMDAEVR